MIDIVTIAGSPSYTSKSSAVLEYSRDIAEARGLETGAIVVRDLNPEDLLFGRANSPSIQSCAALLEQARGVIVATPIYKAAYSGVLKAFLDLLPQTALAGKVVLPIATGGSPAHLLAIDYALKPVLSALGASHILGGIYILDNQIKSLNEHRFSFDEDVERRLNQSLYTLITSLSSREITSIKAIH